ncbi:MAG: hypothetical protein HY722_17205 [Planctomycetes bacterium]|nr:hypothetical protein [Planctomycetota bacterium]
MEIPSEVELRQFVQDLSSQRGLYRLMAELSARQAEALLRGDGADLAAVAARKAEVLGEVEAIDRRAGPLKLRWGAIADAVGPALRAEVEREVEGIRAILAELVSTEDEGQHRLEALRRAAGERLRAVDLGRRAGRAYAGSAPEVSSAEARFLDQVR